MRTAYGKECVFYYQDFHRGRSLMECRLLGSGGGWAPELCRDCPVPEILLDNACPDMVLQGRVASRFLGLGRRVSASAYCRRSQQAVADPHVGCPVCHRGIREILPPP